MAGNIPFIRYKIYSTSTPMAKEKFQTGSKVRVLCFLPDGQSGMQPFLEKILSAARIPGEEYRIVFIEANEQILASDHSWLGTIEYFLLFGISASSIGLQIAPHHYNSDVISGSKIIQVPDLSRIQSDSNEKQKLWHLLKKEFLHD